MNGLAQLAVKSGYAVSGSDRGYDPSTGLYQCLEQSRIRIFPQDGSGIGPETAQVVFSTAIESDNPDLAAARSFGIPLLHRTEFLKQLMGTTSELIAVAGTAGKTTTTGMLGWIFESLGRDPSVYNGAAVLNWKTSDTPGNVRKGNAPLWIIEADESDRSFLHFEPDHSIITNISRDHHELDELHALFSRFRAQTTGQIIDGTEAVLASDKPGTFRYRNIEFKVPMPGRHNLENALCAVRLCAALGMDLNQVREALLTFRGIERRLEEAGATRDGNTVIDDYAHNPAKIAAALAAVSSTYPRVHAYWRPHGYAPLSQHMDALVEVFCNHAKKGMGMLYILPVYYAGGTVERTASSEVLAERLDSAGLAAEFVPDYDTLKNELEACARVGDAILGMGARDPELPRFAKRLVDEWKNS